MNIRRIITKAITASKQDEDLFARFFRELYRIPLFKYGLDLTLTKADVGLMEFEVVQLQFRGTLAGCCLTTEQRIYNKFIKAFFKRHKHKIILRDLTVDTLMHEIAHALEKESGLDISKDFAAAFKADMANYDNAHMNLRRGIDQIIMKELTLYPKEKINSELLARYFQLIATAKEVAGYKGDFHFKTADVFQLFPSTTKWIEEIFNESLKKQIDKKIAQASSELIKNLGEAQKIHNAKSLHADKTNPKWSKITPAKLDQDL
jgi:hypothetical protein